MRGLMLSLVVVAATMMIPQFATPAHALSDWQVFETVKIKTTWGGGWVVNVGGTAGSTAPGTSAKIHHNFSWDFPNRFSVSFPHPEGGYAWHMLNSRTPGGGCLTIGSSGFVMQQPCDGGNPAQYWSEREGISENSTLIRNLAEFRAGRDTVMTQFHFQFVGSQLHMAPLSSLESTRDWIITKCLVNGVDVKDC